MLTHIFIKNFAIIRSIDIDLQRGLNIISGETGTGKSIVIHAISVALGGRGSASLIAEGADRALVQLVFSPESAEAERIGSDPELCRFLEGGEQELIISREFQRSGKSLARINGEIVTLGILHRLTDHLVDIHGQYDNQAFLDPERHLGILDSCGGPELRQAKAQVAEIFGEYHSVRNRLLQLRSDRAAFLRKQDYLRFELEEIQNAGLKPGEDAQLEDRLKVLQNSEKIHAALTESYEILSASQLEHCRQLLAGIADYSPQYGALSEALSESVYVLSDLTEELRRCRDGVTFRPEEIDQIMNRLGMMDNLKRKYGGTLEEVLKYAENCSSQLEMYTDSEEEEKQLTSRLSALRKQLAASSEELRRLRRHTAQKLSEDMTAELSELNFADAKFQVVVEPHEKPDGKPVFSAEGADRVLFLFNANKGGTPKPLSEVASGGEISRIALAFKRLTNTAEQVPTIIFDEIDTGISGITASVVGRKLHEISRQHQVLCITHLPQIAACGDYQYLIAKDNSDERSYSTIQMLSEEERIPEIARLLGGSNITETTLASAAELLGFSHR